MLDIKDIDSKLAYPGFWTQSKLIFLLAIKETCPNKIVRDRDLTNIGNAIERLFSTNLPSLDRNNKPVQYRFTKKDYEDCNDVLEHLQNNGWVCSFFQLKRKVERPNLLPAQQKTYQQAAEIKAIQNLYWSGKSKNRDQLFEQLIAEIISGTGLPYHIVYKALSKSIDQHPKGFIQTPIAEGSRRTTLHPLSARATLLFEYAKRNLDLVHPKEFDENNPIYSAPLLAYLSGMESVIYAQLHRRQLPVPLPNPNKRSPTVFRYLKTEFNQDTHIKYPFLIKRESTSDILYQNQKPIAESHLLPELDHDANHAEDTLDWTQECLITIGAIRSELKKCLTNRHGDYFNGKVDTHQVESVLQNAFQKTLARAERRAKSKATALDEKNIEADLQRIKRSSKETGLAVAISYIRYQLCDLKNTLDTCLIAINQVFERGILRYPTFNLNAWDEEDIEIVLSDYMLERDGKLAESTQASIVQSFRRVITYCKKLHIFHKIELPNIESHGVVLTRRNHVVGLREFDLLKNINDPFLYLAFYGGMRSGEISRLTMNDVVSIADELTIYIRRGKTPSAKRAIPLHLMAPPKVVSFIQDYYETRKSYYRAYRKKSIRSKNKYLMLNEAPFIDLKIKEFHSDSGVVAARYNLAKLQSTLGGAANFHLLRHSFASHIFLRWYCCKHPDLVKSLIDDKHWCFSKNGIENLRLFFGEDPLTPLYDSNTTAIIHLIKLMGHRNTSTFFQVYVHSYYEVLAHAVKRINKENDKSILPGKLISELIPGMKSRSSQVKLALRSVSYLA